ncbi:MAG TPA: hypothetical protein VD713_07265, partial [Sphingomonadales bacterium]|nr:hypothetical protein [Sphingomonadales bacterium]
MKRTLSPESTKDISRRLRDGLEAFARQHPGEGGQRQPVHTVYGGAHLFKADSARRLGALAQRALDDYAPDAVTFARAIGLRGAEQLSASEVSNFRSQMQRDPAEARKNNPIAWLADTIHRRVREKLEREAVEDFRLDYEDGYG